MRNRYIVTYDISDSKRLRKMFKKMNGFGDPLQYSVFVCDLSAKEKILMEETLTEIINSKEDRILIVDIGPVGGRGTEALRTLGCQSKPSAPTALIV